MFYYYYELDSVRKESQLQGWRGSGGLVGAFWMVIRVGQMPPPVCVRPAVTLTNPEGQNAALPRSWLRLLDERLSAAARGKVSNDCLLLF